MCIEGIVGVHKPAKVLTTIPAEHAPRLPDLLARRFTPAHPMWPGSATSPNGRTRGPHTEPLAGGHS